MEACEKHIHNLYTKQVNQVNFIFDATTTLFSLQQYLFSSFQLPMSFVVAIEVV